MEASLPPPSPLLGSWDVCKAEGLLRMAKERGCPLQVKPTCPPTTPGVQVRHNHNVSHTSVGPVYAQGMVDISRIREIIGQLLQRVRVHNVETGWAQE